jgi:hypothetical protein
VLALWVIEHLDVVEHVLPCCFPGQVGAAADAFPLQEMEEAFGHRIVMAVPGAARARLQIVLAQEHLPLAAGELRPLVGVDHHLGLRLSPPDGRKQGLQREVGRHAGLRGPADDAT